LKFFTETFLSEEFLLRFFYAGLPKLGQVWNLWIYRLSRDFIDVNSQLCVY